MTETAFFYPSVYWGIPAALLLALLIFALMRNFGAALFMGIVVMMACWVAHEGLLKPRMEKWLQSQRVYAILFADFPQDKERFVSEYVNAYKSKGEEGLAQKREEMKIVMMEHHVKHYIDRTPAATLNRYILAQTWLLSDLSKKDPNLCNHYMITTKYFANVWQAVGSKLFLESIRYNPFMITQAVDTPEPVSVQDRQRAILLSAGLIKTLAESAGTMGARAYITSCDGEYRLNYTLSQMPPKDGALVLKFLLSEDHLKPQAQKSFLQSIMPF